MCSGLVVWKGGAKRQNESNPISGFPLALRPYGDAPYATHYNIHCQVFLHDFFGSRKIGHIFGQFTAKKGSIIVRRDFYEGIRRGGGTRRLV